MLVRRPRTRRNGRRRRPRRGLLLLLQRCRCCWPSAGRGRGAKVAGEEDRGGLRWRVVFCRGGGVVGRGGRRPFGLALSEDVLQLLPVLGQVLQRILSPPSPLLRPCVVPRMRTTVTVQRVVTICALSAASSASAASASAFD